MEHFKNPYQQLLDMKLFVQKSERLTRELLETQEVLAQMIAEQNIKIEQLTSVLQEFKKGNDK